jgi:hypothetical protein
VPVIAILLAVSVTTILLPLNPLFAGSNTLKVHGPGNTSSCSSSSSTNSVGASSSVSGSSGSCSTNSSSSSKTTTAGFVIITSGQSSVGLSTNSPGAASSTSTGAGQSCCSFATAEEAFSSISQTGGCPYFSFFPTEQSKQYKV